MGKSRKSRTLRKNKKNNKNNKQIGGLLEEFGLLPPVDKLSQFAITDTNLQNFNRTFNAPMDCFISALQLMGILDDISANIMRISTLGVVGFTKAQIEIIFAYKFRKNFDFKSTTNFNEWATWINTLLIPGNVVFAGYTGHVFLIGRMLNGTLIYIEPQLNMFCDLNTEECIKHLRNKNDWSLLFHSDQHLTADQEAFIIQYTQALASSSVPPNLHP